MKIRYILLITVSLFFSFMINTALCNDFVDIEENNNAWIVWTGDTAAGTKLFYTHWDGKEWSDPELMFPNTAMTEHSPHVALDVEKVPYVVFVGEKEGASEIFCTHIRQGKCAQCSSISSYDESFDGQPYLGIDKKNNLHVVWVGNGENSDEIYYAVKRNGIWSPEKRISRNDPWPDMDPTINIDARQEPVVVWSGYDGSKYRLFSLCKQDGKWGEEKPVENSTSAMPDEFPAFRETGLDLFKLYWLREGNVFSADWDNGEWDFARKVDLKLVNRDVAPMLEGIIPEQVSLAWVDQSGARQSLRYALFVENRINKKVDDRKAVFKGAVGKRTRFWDFGPRNLFADIMESSYTGFGDSITEGDVGNPAVGSYPSILAGKLTSEYGSSIVFNEGYGGEKTNIGLERIDSVLADHDAGTILIMEGTNDVAVGRSPSYISFNLEQMATKSIDYGTAPILGTVTPRLDGYNSAVERLNVYIKDVAGNLGIQLADQFAAINGNPDKESLYSDARLHFNATGNNIIADTWLSSIQKIRGGGKKGGGGCGSIHPVNNGFHINNGMLITVVMLIFIIRKRYACVSRS